MINEFQDLLRTEPDVFEELDLDDLVPNTPIQNKGKDVPRKKNTTRSVHVGLGTVEGKREEKVSEIWNSLQGRIIRKI